MTDTPEDSARKLAREVADLYGRHVNVEPARVREIIARFIEERDREKDAEWSGWGTIEVAIRNPNVSSFMDHWTARAEKAEAECAKLREEGQRDYDGMRHFQSKFIAADDELRAARTALAEARGLLDEALDVTGKTTKLATIRTKIEAFLQPRDRTMATGEPSRTLVDVFLRSGDVDIVAHDNADPVHLSAEPPMTEQEVREHLRTCKGCAEPPAPVAEPKCVLCEEGWAVQTDKGGRKFHIDFCGNFGDVVPEAGSIAPCPAAPDPVKPKEGEGG